MKNFKITMKFSLEETDLDNEDFKELKDDIASGEAVKTLFPEPYKNANIIFEEDETTLDETNTPIHTS